MTTSDRQQKYSFLISQYMRKYIDEQKKILNKVGTWGSDVCDRFVNFSNKGKMIRGKLLLDTYFQLSNKDPQMLVPAAVALELIQSSLLIHDDIMDKDLIRRGQPTLFATYSKIGQDKNFRDFEHLGKSLAICVGDIGFFWAFSLLNKTAHEFGVDIITKCTEEFSLVGVAQMLDVYNGFSEEQISEDEILNLYLYKTARYTFSIPLVLGGIIAGTNTTNISVLEKIGEYLGLIFQIRDDEIGIFSDTKKIGKIAGSDIKEGKKTIYFYYLLKSIDKNNKVILDDIWGNPLIKDSDLRYIRNLILKLGIQDSVQKLKNGFQQKTMALIEQSDLSEELKKSLAKTANNITLTTT